MVVKILPQDRRKWGANRLPGVVVLKRGQINIQVSMPVWYLGDFIY